MSDLCLVSSRRFALAAKAHFTQADFIYLEVQSRMLERLAMMKVTRGTVLEIQPHQAMPVEWSDFPRAQQVDCIEQLRCLAPASVDLVYSNLSLSAQPIQDMLIAIRRCLKPNGLFLFSLLGPDTLMEMRASFSHSSCAHVAKFHEMHHVGDQLLKMGFSGPVTESQKITIRYRTLQKLFLDLRNMGVQNALQSRHRGLTGKAMWKKMCQHYDSLIQDGRYPLTCECILGHAWQPEQPSSRYNKDGEAVFDVNQITRKSDEQ